MLCQNDGRSIHMQRAFQKNKCCGLRNFGPPVTNLPKKTDTLKAADVLPADDHGDPLTGNKRQPTSTPCKSTRLRKDYAPHLAWGPALHESSDAFWAAAAPFPHSPTPPEPSSRAGISTKVDNPVEKLSVVEENPVLADGQPRLQNARKPPKTSIAVFSCSRSPWWTAVPNSTKAIGPS